MLSWSIFITVVTPTEHFHYPWVNSETEHWLLLLFNSLQGQLNGFHLCKLTPFTFSFRTFYDSSCLTPHSSIPLLMISQNTTRFISKHSIMLLIFWKFTILQGFCGTSDLHRQWSKISAFWPVHEPFQDSWVVRVLHLSLQCNQCYLLTLQCWLHDV